MNPGLTDPHNHAPPVSADDEWGDGDFAESGGMTMLPPKRARSSPPQGQGAAAKPEAGLRIDASPVRLREEEDAAPRLEVQQFDGSVVRLAPDESGPERAPRKFSFLARPPAPPQDGRTDGEAREWGAKKRYPIRWMIGAGVGVTALVVGAMTLLPGINQNNAVREGQIRDLVIDAEEKPIDGLDRMNDMFVREDEANQVFRNYAEARIVDDFLPIVRDAKTLEPLIRSRFVPLNVPKDWSPRKQAVWSVGGEAGAIHGVLEGTLPDFSEFRAYLILEDGQLRMDWKATTAYGTADFGELASGRGDASEIRGLIEPTGFYSAAFPEETYRCYQLLSADRENTLWCYTQKGSPADTQIGLQFQEGVILKATDGPVKVTLRLERGPEGALPNQWLIREMLHKDWIMP